MDLLKPGPKLDAVLEAAGVEVTHQFVGNRYAKLTKIPKGVFVGMHAHAFDHDSVLLLGAVNLVRDGTQRFMHAPAVAVVPAGVEHQVEALEDSLWACLWDNPLGITDPDEFDSTVIAP